MDAKMPPPRARLRPKATIKGMVDKVASSKPKQREPDDEKAPKSSNPRALFLKNLLDLKNENKSLTEETKKVQKEHEELLLLVDSESTAFEKEVGEKEALLKECQCLEQDSKKQSSLQRDETSEALKDFDEKTDGKQLVKLSEKLIKELVDLKKREEGFRECIANENSKHKVYAELRRILNREHREVKGSFGRVLLKQKTKEIMKLIDERSKELCELNDARNVSPGDCWERAAEKYGAEMKELMEEKGRLENEFLDKEERLKNIKECETFVDNDIVSKTAKIERQSEVNRKQIFNSPEFKELMEHRDGLIARIEKSMSIIEDTKEACCNAIIKSDEVHLNLLKTQKRVQELTSKTLELSNEVEEERMRMMEASAKMDYVSHELNAKNGVLLRLEVEVEELESSKEMLEENLSHCQLQIENHKEKNAGVQLRIGQLSDQYFSEAYTCSM